MTKETKQLARTERMLRDLSVLLEAIELQQVRASGTQRRELTGAVPVTLHDFAHGLRLEIDRVLDPIGQ